MKQITVQELSTRLQSDELQVLDVRREGEWQAGHIDGVDWYSLDRFKEPCRNWSGMRPSRSTVKAATEHACCLMQRAGYNVINVIGGFDAWEQAQLPASAAVVGV